jgi:hypothetical protein
VAGEQGRRSLLSVFPFFPSFFPRALSLCLPAATSKALAEKAAWDFVSGEDVSFAFSTSVLSLSSLSSRC